MTVIAVIKYKIAEIIVACIKENMFLRTIAKLKMCKKKLFKKFSLFLYVCHIKWMTAIVVIKYNLVKK